MSAADCIAQADRKLASIAKHTAAIIVAVDDYPPSVWRDLLRGCADDVVYWRAYRRLVQCRVPDDRASHDAAEFAYA